MTSARQLRILGISGSLRTASYNSALLRAAAESMLPAMSLEVATIGDLPLYNRDVEVEGLPASVHRIRTQLMAADGVLFACPEYNWSITGALKNAIDWLSRNPASPIDHKPGAIVGGGGRGGGARAQSHLREVLAHNRVQVYEESEVVVPRVWTAFDDALRLVDDRVEADLRTLVAGFEADVRRDIAHRPAIVALGRDPSALAKAYRALIADYRVVPAFDPDQLAPLVQRWSAAALLVGGDAEAPAVGIPVVRIDDVDELPAMLAEAVGS